MKVVEKKLSAIHPQIVNAGLVDTAAKAFEAGRRFRSEDVDLIFLYVTTSHISHLTIFYSLCFHMVKDA